MEIITKRFGNVRDVGNSLGLTLREELMDMKLENGSQVLVTLYFDEVIKKKKIVIEEAD